ncbi:hypothetical protein ACS0TY_004710 [Phlomoides rotata]
MAAVLIAMFLLGSSIELANCKYMVYNTSQGILPDKLNVHLVPHTHDDVGWLKTVDQYYVGSNNSIQWACVQNVLDSLIPALIADKNRKFIYVEQIGFDSLFFGRIDYQDRAKRKTEKSLEVIWRGSKSLGSSSQIFAGAFPKNYEPAPGDFYYEVNDDSPIVQDNINLFDYNVQERGDAFVAAALSQANITRTNHIMWTMGTDFKYQYAHTWFRKMDKLIHYVNIAVRQLEFFKGRNKSGSSTDLLGDALAIAQHHDAVTGTEQQHVANDYAKRLSMGYVEAEELAAESLSCLVEPKSSSGCEKTTKFQQCPLLNISYCPPSEIDLSNGKGLIVVVYNALGWEREDVVQIPVMSESITVRDSAGRELESQLLPLSDTHVNLRNYHVKVYLGQTGKHPARHRSTRSSIQSFQDSDGYNFEVGHDHVELTFSSEGKLIHYVNDKNAVNESVQQSFSYYSGFNGSDEDPQSSGAYVLPNCTFSIKPQKQGVLTVIRGPMSNLDVGWG